MKTPSSDIFTLIKSLTPSEKRYFTVYSGIHSSKTDAKSYMRLFAVIDRMQEYDEEKVKKAVNKIIPPDQFKVFKSYLSDAILKSLENFHSSDSGEIFFMKKLHQAEILFHKGLFEIAVKVLDKAIKVAEEQEQFMYLILLWRLKRRVISFTNNLPELERYSKGFPEDLEYLHKIENQIRYSELLYRTIFTYRLTHQGQEKELKPMINSVVDNELYKNAALATSSESVITFHKINVIHSRLEGDWERSYQDRKRFVEYFENRKLYNNRDIFEYIIAVNGLLGSLSYFRKKDEFKYYYERARSFYRALTDKQKTRQIIHLYTQLGGVYADFLDKMGEFAEVIKVCLEEEKHMTRYEGSMAIYNHYRLFLNYFYLMQYKNALRYLNKILKYSGEGIKQDVIDTGRLYSLIIHYELKNYELLSSLCKSVKRSLKKKGYLYELEKLVIELFEKLVIDTDRKQNTTLLLEAKNKAIDIQLKEPHFDEYFDLIPWLASKIEKRPLTEIMREKRMEKIKNQS